MKLRKLTAAALCLGGPAASNGGKVLSMYRSDNTAASPSGQSDPHFPALDRAQAQTFLDRVLTAGETAVFSENASTPSLSSAHRNFRGKIRLNGLPSPLGFNSGGVPEQRIS